MADDAYETDIVGWSEDQSARLRRVAAGEAPPDGAGVDWPNVIEEIESVGRWNRYTVLTEFRAALRHLLMAHGWPDHPDASRWLDAADNAISKAQTFSDPGMEGRLDLHQAYRDAWRMVDSMRIDGRAPRPLPAAIPLGFRDLRDDVRDPVFGSTELLRRIRAAAEENPLA